MKFDRLYTDSTQTDQPQGSYRFAKNLVDSTTLGSLENEKGFLDKNLNAPYTVIGEITINDGFIVFSTDDTNCEIGKYITATNTYSTIYNNPLLGFRRIAPIKGEYRIEVTGNRVITWIDDINVPRILNIDNLSLINNVNDLNIFQDIQNPTLSSHSISDFGGSLPVGAYVPITLYKGLDGSTTSWFVHDKVFYINDEPKTTPFQNDDGAPGLTPTNKAINLTFTGCDTNYDNLVVGFIRIASQITTAYSVTTKTISPTINVTLTGSESLTTIGLDAVLTANSVYNNAKAITQINNQLVLANLTSEALPSFQPYATAIKVNYTTGLSNVISNIGSHKDVLPPTLMPGEVYALYIGLELTKGGWAFYHIPGRTPVAGETSTIITGDGLMYLKYQVDDTTDAGGAATNMGYWENVSETYPNDPIYNGSGVGGTDLRGVNVRHHRMPTVGKLETSFYSGDATVGVTNLVKLGISVSNVNIPVAVQSKIKRWKIFFAKKSANNSIMGGSDILHYPSSPPASSTVYWTTGGNWTIDAAHSGWEGFTIMHQDAMLGHCLDHLYAPNEFTPDFAYFNYGLTNNTVNSGGNPIPYAGFRGGGSELSTTGSNRGQTVGIVLDYTEPSTAKTAINVLRKLNNYQYVSQNSKVGKYKSAYSESFFTSEFTPLPAIGGLFSPFPSLQTKGSSDVEPNPVQFSKGEQTVFLQYGKIVANAHSSFTSQDLVPFEGYALPSVTSIGTILGGDTFLCYMSYLAAGPLCGNFSTQSGSPGLQGVRAWKAYVGYSRRNWNYRYQTVGTPSTYYYGKIDVTTLYSPPLQSPVNKATTGTTGTLLSSFDTFNQVTYNPDFDTSNIYTVGTTYSTDLVNASQFPNLIIYSPVQGSESIDISWRIFPAGNRYTMPKNKGAIINLQGIGNIDLLIHHQYSLYKTRTNAGLQADSGENIFLKSNDLFALAPQELLSTNTGYCGTQNKFACVLSKAGYAFVDDLQGKIFLYAGEQPEEISSFGLRKFFRDNMGVKQDNPFYLNGYTIAYDEYHNRLLVTKKQDSTSWTISYNPSKKTWTSYHDYTPDYMVNAIDNTLWSFKGSHIYQHNIGPRGVYYTTQVYPSMVDLVHNPEPTRDKIFMEANWLSESYDNTTGVLQYTDTVTALTFRSLDYCSGRILTSVFSDIDLLYTNNIRNLNRTWYYNEIRDISLQPGFTLGFYQNYELDLTKLNTNMEWYDQRKFVDKFVLCRLEYANTTGNRFLLLESDIEYRYAPK